MATTRDIEITALRKVPDGARGLVRDIRVRWALEEAGLPYSVRPMDMRMDLRDARPAAYLAENPFGQVPVYREGAVTMFESGAIVLHIGETSEALLPRDPHGRGRATSWLVAVLRVFARTGLVGEFPTLADYVKGGDARPAFQRALAMQIADFERSAA